MKNMVIVLLLIQLYLQDIFCDDSFLSNFHQNEYKMRDIRAELISYNKKYFNFFEIRTFKFNRTTPAINGTVNVKIDMKDKIEVVVQAYKFLSNEYRRFPVRFQVNGKKAFDSNVVGIKKTLANCGNLTSVHFEKDVTYHICNFVVDETHLPPLIPSGRFKVDMQYLYLNEEIAMIYGFGEVYTPIAYPKK